MDKDNLSVVALIFIIISLSITPVMISLHKLDLYIQDKKIEEFEVSHHKVMKCDTSKGNGSITEITLCGYEWENNEGDKK